VWHGTADLARRLVLAEPFVDNLAEQIVLGPGQILDLGDELGPHPMDAGQNQRRAEPVAARWRILKRHIGRRQWLQTAPQGLQLRMVDARADPAGVNQPAIRIVVGEQQRSEPGPRTDRIGPTDHHEFLAVQAFDLEPQTAIAGGIGASARFETIPSSFKSHA